MRDKKWGGKRAGAGRRKGVPNKATAERQAAIAASGEAPLDYMIRVMRDETAPVKRRDEIAPYVHPRLAAIQHSGQLPTKPAHLMTDDELAAIAAGGPSSSNQVPVDPKRVN